MGQELTGDQLGDHPVELFERRDAGDELEEQLADWQTPLNGLQFGWAR